MARTFPIEGTAAARDNVKQAQCVVNAAYKGMQASIPFVNVKLTGSAMKQEVIQRHATQQCSNWPIGVLKA